MNVLFISRSDSGKPHPFIEEQASALIENFGVSIRHFLIRQGGVIGYIRAAKQLADYVSENKPDLLHVHYGLAGLVAVIHKIAFLNRIKFIITYHGSDINKVTERQLSLLAARFAAHNIVVSEKMLKYFKNSCSVVPCGVDTEVELTHRESTRRAFNWGENDFIVLFSSNFGRSEKDPAFAFKVIKSFSSISSRSVKFIELKGYSREELTKLMQAADALIMCSSREGSPQVIKEAILNSLPIVSNDVGEVRSICSNADNCFIVPKKVDEYVKRLQFLSIEKVRIQNRTPVLERYSNKLISDKLYNIYSKALK
ncbi:glycosyltransferase family 4 protein [Pontibacter litorisediminis]|uniref:glycosyltransferase family 4 protein n=1 Tax=Pontibacter litorisediminis TaxID=1846260 RepID=UPI0023EB7AA7|nr:glycosyltransferase family 4 protein [Pontibacter litorisediminis]